MTASQLLSNKAVEFLIDNRNNKVSNCCGAQVYNDTCQDCYEHCEAVIEEQI